MHAYETRVYLAILTSVGVLLALMAFFILTIIRYQKNKITFHQNKIRDEINSLEKERLRIATDLHDDLGASLSAIKLRLQCLHPINKDETIIVSEAKNYIDDTMRKLRAISFNMMPQILQRNGLPDALNDLIETLTYGLNIKTYCNCTINPSDHEMRVHIYRIMQEVLNNTIRHSMAGEVHLFLGKKGKIIEIHIWDDGVGFDNNSKVNKNVGQGLQNIMARVDVLKAKMFLTTSPGKGVDYLIKIPSYNDGE